MYRNSKADYFVLDKKIKESEHLLNGIDNIGKYYNEYLEYIKTCTPEELYNKYESELILYGYIIKGYNLCLNQLIRQNDDILNFIHKLHYEEKIGYYINSLFELKQRYEEYKIESDEYKEIIEKHNTHENMIYILEAIYEEFVILEEKIDEFLKSKYFFDELSEIIKCEVVLN